MLRSCSPVNPLVCSLFHSMQDLIVLYKGSASLDVKLQGKKFIILSFICVFFSLFAHPIVRAY